MTTYNKIVLPGSEGYWDGWEFGRELEAAFPLQDGGDFAAACQYNGYGPLGYGDATVGVVGLLMVEQGEHDGPNWVWLVTTHEGEHWWAIGGCDFTGWDCQSSLDWTLYEEPVELTDDEQLDNLRSIAEDEAVRDDTDVETLRWAIRTIENLS